MAKEQTAQAIAKTADVYEKDGILAALDQVRVLIGGPLPASPALALLGPLLLLLLPSSHCLLLLLSPPSLPRCCHSPRRQMQRRPPRRKAAPRRRQKSPRKRGRWSLLPHPALKSQRWRSPVWGRSSLGQMRTAITRRYRLCRGSPGSQELGWPDWEVGKTGRAAPAFQSLPGFICKKLRSHRPRELFCS